MILRPYQHQALADAQAAFRGGARGVLLVAPTGAGKTAIAAAAIAAAIAQGRTALMVAPRREIVAQTSARLAAVGVRHGIIAAGVPQPDAGAPVQVAMAQTARRRLESIGQPALLIVDEAHLDEAGDVVDAYPDAWRLLLTATPLRSSGRSWRGLADALVEAETVRGLIDAGYLVEPMVWSARQPDLTGIRRGAGGELAPGETGARYATPSILGDTIVRWRMHCAGRRTLVFASSVAHSATLRDALRAVGARAEHIDGTTPAPERQRILDALAAHDIDAVCNYGVLCEGLDIPAVSAAIVARATQSESLWRQMVGRALRPAPGKADAAIIDQGGNAYRHDHPASPRVWTLDGVDRAPREIDPLRTCAACMAIWDPAIDGPACPRCGEAPAAEPRKPPRVLSRVELALLRPDGSAAPCVIVDGQRKAPRPMPTELSEAWRPAWEQVELQRLTLGAHWRSSLHAMRRLGAPVEIPHAFG